MIRIKVLEESSIRFVASLEIPQIPSKGDNILIDYLYVEGADSQDPEIYLVKNITYNFNCLKQLEDVTVWVEQTT